MGGTSVWYSSESDRISGTLSTQESSCASVTDSQLFLVFCACSSAYVHTPQQRATQSLEQAARLVIVMVTLFTQRHQTPTFSLAKQPNPCNCTYVVPVLSGLAQGTEWKHCLSGSHRQGVSFSCFSLLVLVPNPYTLATHSSVAAAATTTTTTTNGSQQTDIVINHRHPRDRSNE